MIAISDTEPIIEVDTVESVEPMSDIPTFREWAKETIAEHRAHHEGSAGTLVGERFNHRGWPPDVTLA